VRETESDLISDREAIAGDLFDIWYSRCDEGTCGATLPRAADSSAMHSLHALGLTEARQFGSEKRNKNVRTNPAADWIELLRRRAAWVRWSAYIC